MPAVNISPAEARRVLTDGYTRFVTGRAIYPDQASERRTDVASTPRPVAIVLGCADSRVPPELIFDQGFGSLFVVRIAGNAVTDAVLGSIEIAVREMGAPLVVVLGHTRCRAVETAVQVLDGVAVAEGHATAVVEPLAPAVAATARGLSNRLDSTIRVNVRLTAERLRAADPVLAPAVQAGSLEVAGWLYDVETGIVEMLT